MTETPGGGADEAKSPAPVIPEWRLERELVPGWLRPSTGESRISVAIAILVAAVLQGSLPGRFTLLHPNWLLPGAELVLLATLAVMNPLRRPRRARAGRCVALTLVAVISASNGISAGLLDTGLIRGTAGSKAAPLLGAAAAIYLTNVIAFGIWYWELDRGGPFARAAARSPYPDFLFPQMTQHHLARKDWRPRFADYLYVSFTNATAFSPTDTMPLTRWTKLLMAVQSAIALSTTALVIARAVNILP
jgi:hypothetical protein